MSLPLWKYKLTLTAMTHSSPQQLSIDNLHNRSLGQSNGIDMFLSHDFAVADLQDAPAFLGENVEIDQPYQWTDHRFILVVEGDADFTANLKDYHMSHGMIAIIGKGCIVQLNRYSPDYRVVMLAFDDVYLPYVYSNKESNRNLEFFNTTYVAQANDRQQQLLSSMTTNLLHVVKQGVYNQNLIGAYVSAVINYSLLIQPQWTACNGQGNSRPAELFNRFLHLANANSVNQRQLQYYADRLCISKKYLCLVVKTMSGMTAKEWIDLGALNHAKVMLRRTHHTIAGISNAMGFSQDSAFSKFFKRIAGISPQQYRQQHNLHM